MRFFIPGLPPGTPGSLPGPPESTGGNRIEEGAPWPLSGIILPLSGMLFCAVGAILAPMPEDAGTGEPLMRLLALTPNDAAPTPNPPPTHTLGSRQSGGCYGVVAT